MRRLLSSGTVKERRSETEAKISCLGKAPARRAIGTALRGSLLVSRTRQLI
jgi:hypothetical protein